MLETKLLRKLVELEKFVSEQEDIKLYGAGMNLRLLLKELETMNADYLQKIECIFVSDATKNPERVGSIPVVEYDVTKVNKGDCIMLTLGDRYADIVQILLQENEVQVVRLNFNMFQERPYWEIYEHIRPFIEEFPNKISGLNEFVKDDKRRAWTLWWQGIEQAPDIVKACWESQRRNLPADCEHIIITKDNYKKYIAIPAYILEKVNQGKISLTHLSDICRSVLLYKYGGLWLDSTILLHKPISEAVWEHSFYSRNIPPDTHFCCNGMWATFYLRAKPGNKLFQFVSEAFLYYFTKYEELTYYLTIDYLIAIACNLFPEVEKQVQEVPFNNDTVWTLSKHIMEKYDSDMYDEYLQGTYFQKLTYKLDWQENSKENTFYSYILEEYNVRKNEYWGQ